MPGHECTVAHWRFGLHTEEIGVFAWPATRFNFRYLADKSDSRHLISSAWLHWKHWDRLACNLSDAFLSYPLPPPCRRAGIVRILCAGDCKRGHNVEDCFPFLARSRFVFVKDVELVRTFLSGKTPVLNCFTSLGQPWRSGRYVGKFCSHIFFLHQRYTCPWGPGPLSDTVVRQWNKTSNSYGSRQTFTSPPDTVLRLMKIAHAGFLSDAWHCPIMTSKSCL